MKRERFSEHLRSVRNNSPGFPVAQHFYSAFNLMQTHVTNALTLTFLFHSCVSRACTLHASARSSLGFLYSVCQLATTGFFTQMKGSARNVCTIFFKCSLTLLRVFHYLFPVFIVSCIIFQFFISRFILRQLYYLLLISLRHKVDHSRLASS